ncbi:MAG: malonyl-CoA decarboxylase family protein [Thermodesulfobacteriota bacterium]
MENKLKKKSPASSQMELAGSLVQDMKEAAQARMVERPALEKIKNGYVLLGREDKPLFFSQLLENMEVRPGDVASLLAEAGSCLDDLVRWRKTVSELRSVLESPRSRLFRNFASLPGGLKFLLDFRADLMAAQRVSQVDLSPLDQDLVQLFESWFQDGFLFLQEITLDSPYRQIEKIKDGDMVHPMSNLEEMARRLGRDRRCFALYHQAMPEEPVVFIEVALTRGIVRSVHEIIGVPAEAEEVGARNDTAVFYSINNTQNGLAGLGLGQVLIFQVVDYLKREAPEIKTFCTLSPLPGFWRRYLHPLLENRATGLKMNLDRLEKIFDKRTRGLLEKEYAARGGKTNASFDRMMLAVFSNPGWAEDKALVASLAKPLAQLGYFYLAEEKDRGGRPLDPVANFHLSNGATLAPGNVNFGANWSARGLERSLSLMANYIYSHDWRMQIKNSMTWLVGLMPGLSRRRNNRARLAPAGTTEPSPSR